MGNKKIGLGLMLNLIGAMFAYLIGSGFASGQETMQYFSGWGSVWASLGVAAIALLLSCLAYIAYSYAGRTRGLQDLAGIYDFYAGNVFGKLFQVFAWLFNACCYMFMISAFVGTIGYNLREYKFIYNQLIMIISSGGIMLVSFLMGLNHIGNIQAAVQASIPNLLLANSVFGGNAGIILSLLFAIIILAAIFSTICPMLWTCASMLAKDDKSKKYKLICVIAGICVYIITLFVPYETLLNYIMTYCGYSGCVVAVVCIVRYFIIRSRDKKEGLFKESV